MFYYIKAAQGFACLVSSSVTLLYFLASSRITFCEQASSYSPRQPLLMCDNSTLKQHAVVVTDDCVEGQSYFE